MHAYRFRILAEEQDEFLRDVEILASQSFEDFHQFLVQLFEFDGRELASFSVCNGKWHKLCEITLIDMDFDKEDSLDDDDKPKKVKLKTYLMGDSRMKNFIEDPHQRIIYEYDFIKQRIFFIELTKIVEAEEGVAYPRCIKAEGVLPKPINPKAGLRTSGDGISDEDVDLDELGLEFEEALDDSFEDNLDDGFEIEIDQNASEDLFDANAEDAGK